MGSKRRVRARQDLRAAAQPRHLAWGVNLLLGGLIAWTALAVVQGVTAPPASVTPRVVAAPPPAPEVPALNLDALIAAQLFGQAAAETGDEVAVEEAVADSSLRLLGVLHDARPERSRALIAIDGVEPAEGRNYSPGQELRPGLVLEEVFSNAALLRSGGRRFHLQLDEGALTGVGDTAALPDAVPDAVEAELPDIDPGAVRADLE